MTEMVTSDIPDGLLRGRDTDVDQEARRLACTRRRPRRVGERPAGPEGPGTAFDYGMLEFSPVSGLDNPLSASMQVRREGSAGRASGVVRFPKHAEGPPGFAHGGFVAAAFDEVLGAAQSTSGRPGMTGILTVQYRRPSPLLADLRLEGSVRKIRSNMVFTEGVLRDGERVLADAEALFILVGEETYRDFARLRREADRRPVCADAPEGCGDGPEASETGPCTERRRLARALRTLASEVVASDGPDRAFVAACAVVEGLIRLLRVHPRRERVISASLEEEIRIEGARYNYGDLMDFSPLSGVSNPMAPPMSLTKEEGGTLGGHVWFSPAFEGAPGLVHGGYIAAAFDELLGLAQSLSGNAGMTGTLRVRYRRPCPTRTDLHLAARVASVEGRKIHVKGSMERDGQIIADAKAVFVTLA